MSGDQFKRRARAVAISASVGEARRRVAERMLMAAAVAAALVQGAWMLHLTLKTVQP